MSGREKKAPKTLPLLATAGLLLLAGLQGTAKAAPDTSHSFAIYKSESDHPTYGRGPELDSFVREGKRTELLVTDSDIDAYDWDNQAIILTPEASKRLPGDLCDFNVKGFIVTLDNKAIYGGTGLIKYSQMAINHPVLYSKSIDGRTVLLVRTRHEFCGRPDLHESGWDEIATPAVMAHFESLHKLRKPWAEVNFQSIQNSTQRIVGLTAKAESNAIVATYDLDGSRTGHYEVTEALSWQCGNESQSFGPKHTEDLDLPGKKTSHSRTFPYAQILKLYPYRVPQLKDNKNKPQFWCVTVWLKPKLGENENAGLDTVQKINIALALEYGGDKDDRADSTRPRPGKIVTSTQTTQLPADWKQLEQK